MKRTGMMVLIFAAVATSMPAAWAQPAKYPERAIRLVVPFPPGGSVDVNARILAPLVSQSLGQQVVVDYRAGASGIIGTGLVARAEPDGYTLLINTTPLVTNTLMYGKVPYNVLTDFAPVSLLSPSPSFLGVHPSVPARSVRELLQLAKSRPGALNYASAGVGTNPQIIATLHDHFRKAMSSADLVRRFEQDGLDVGGGGPDQLAALLDSEVKKWARVIRERGMKAE
ncbi:MAG: hypothetical protein HY526_10775 [Betaproteobacteria bacterium]|nr:hypothetical protein [Betaproteobacteria bacterium]